MKTKVSYKTESGEIKEMETDLKTVKVEPTIEDLMQKISNLEHRISLLERGMKQDETGAIGIIDNRLTSCTDYHCIKLSRD